MQETSRTGINVEANVKAQLERECAVELQPDACLLIADLEGLTERKPLELGGCRNIGPSGIVR